MKRNVGGADRAVRWIVGIALLALAFFTDMANGWQLLAFLAGAAAVLTALSRYCPLNATLRVDTSAREPAT